MVLMSPHELPPGHDDESGQSVLIDQATEMLGLSKRKIYYLIREGRLRTIRTRLGSQRVLVESMREFADRPAPRAPRAVPPPMFKGYRW